MRRPRALLDAGCAWRRLALAVGLALCAAAPASAQNGADAGCVLCHGELELLRRHTTSLQDARDLLVSDSTIRASAHDTLSCGSCHSGFERYPHGRGESPVTGDCTSCHAPEDEQWSHGVHAERVLVAGRDSGERATAATCADCHGVHDVVAIDSASRVTRERLTDACVSCHATAALTAADPHADTVTCAGCHSAHETRRVNDPLSQVAPHAQARTCGECHAAPADSFPHDAHGRALASVDPDRARLHADSFPTCSSCHGAHGMRAPSHEAFEPQMVEACGACHARHSETYFGTYHGKATALGSEIVATCHACHGAHAILSADSARSMVSDERLVATCRDCHPGADARFALYDSHPDPWDRERNAPLFYSFIFMNTLLFGVLGVFTLHTALWWLRLWLDSRSGATHGRGGEGGAGGDHV